MYQSLVPIAAAGHRLSFLGALLVGTNPCIPRTPHKTCRLGDALTQSSRHPNLPIVRDAQILTRAHISCCPLAGAIVTSYTVLAGRCMSCTVAALPHLRFYANVTIP